MLRTEFPCCFTEGKNPFFTGKKTFFYTVFEPVKKRFFFDFFHMTD